MIKILQTIDSILTQDSNVSSIVQSKIFPNVAPDMGGSGSNVNYPLLVTNRASIDTQYAKGMCYRRSATVEIICYAVSYSDVVNLAEAVVGALEFYKGTVGNQTITDVELVSASEVYVESVYSQILNFEIRE